MEKPKGFLISCGEEVYPEQWIYNAIEEVRTATALLNIDWIGQESILNEADVEQVRKNLTGMRPDFIVLHFVSWHITPRIMNVLKDFPAIPIVCWSVGGKKDHAGKIHSPAAAAAITSILPILKEQGRMVEVIYEMPDQEHKLAEIEKIAQAAKVYAEVKHIRIGLVGYADMGLFTCAYDKSDIFIRFGIEVEDYFSYEIGKLMEEADLEIEGIIEDIREKFIFENDIPMDTLEKTARLYSALKTKVIERKLDAISIKCVTGVTQHMGINPCMAQSLLADAKVSVICECDLHGLITNVILAKLAEQTSCFMENYEFFEDSILVGTCGFMPCDFGISPLKARSTRLGNFFYGIANVSDTKEGVVTYARLFKEKGEYKMFLGKGIAEKAPDWIELGWEEPTPKFPSLKIRLETPVQNYIETVPGQHIILVYGDYVEQLKQLCKMLNLETVI